MKKILLTRPHASSRRWADLLARRGMPCAIEPLLHVTPLPAPRPQGDFGAVIFTSANAPEALLDRKADIAGLTALPCFCVGPSTGEAARGAGFTDIRCGDADSTALAGTIAETLEDKTRPLLHIAGEHIDPKMRAILDDAGFAVTAWTVYRAETVQDMKPETRTLVEQGDVAAIPVFSPRTARTLVALIEKNRLTSACHGITAIGLSQAVADVLQSLPWKRLCVAATPNEEGILACLDPIRSEPEDPMTQTKPADPAPPVPPAKKQKCGWGLMFAVLLAAAVTVGLTQYSLVLALRPSADMKRMKSEIAALQTRVAALEKTGAQKQAPVAAAGAIVPASVFASPPDQTKVADVKANAALSASLSAAVKDLRTQVAGIKDAQQGGRQDAQKRIATVVAFWDLRREAEAGKPFAAQLAALHAASAGDDTAIAQVSSLFPYSAGVATFAQLRAQLAALEPRIATPEEKSAPPTVAQNFIQQAAHIMHELISVRPLHDPQCAALEEALDAYDATAAQSAFDALPVSAKATLATWHEKLAARASVDKAVTALAAHYERLPEAPAAQSAPQIAPKDTPQNKPQGLAP
ncbi:MAG: uroporphyrinogen-III synthase [Alphaproteobacteria bacterium]|nr:uroporphyrinogen-III synthase [Alphaproteobacteria bacterium]